MNDRPDKLLLSAAAVQCCLSDLRKGSRNLSAQTSNFYLQGIRQFCRWLIKDGRATSEPLKYLKALNTKLDRRHDRRALELDELRRLLRITTESETVHFGLTGPERAILYRIATETGLRANELRSLTVRSFDLKALTVTVQAAYSKHRREDTIPLRANTADMLRSYFAGKLPQARALKMPAGNKLSDMLKVDLAAAGIPYQDDAGRYVDFHALRHTCGSLLIASGCAPKVCQSIMRHADIRVTMDRYVHTYRGQTADAIEKLPDLSNDLQQAKATGTDDRPCDLDQILTKPAYSGVLSRTSTDNKGIENNMAGDTQKRPSDGQKPRFSAKNREQTHSIDVCQPGGCIDYINLS